MVIGNKRRDWVSTLTLPFWTGSDDEAAGVGLEIGGFWRQEYTLVMRGLTGTGARVRAGEAIMYTNKSSSFPLLGIGEERENRVVSKNVTSVDTK